MSRPNLNASQGSTTELAAFQRLVVLAVVVSLAVVAVGGAVRATDSGLACPTWPGCFSAGDFVPALDLNVWLEHSHRLIAGLVGLLIAAILVWALMRYRDRPLILWPAVAAAVGVNIQAGLGAAVVWLQLQAELVTAHLGLGMAVVGCLIYLAVNASPTARPSRADLADRDLGLARTSLAVTALTFVQILVGGHLTGIGAGLVYTREGFPLLGLATFAPVQGEAQAFNVAHRLLAVVLVVAVVVLVRRARTVGATGWVGRLPHIAAALVVLQIGIGVANLWSGLSFLAVIPHLAVASWIWAVLVLLTTFASREARERADTGTDARVAQLAGSGR